MTRQSDIYRRIKINSRRTYRGDGEILDDAQICCPQGDQMVSMDRCATCGQCDGLVFTGEPGRSFIICRKVPTPREVREQRGAAASGAEAGARRAGPTVAEIMTRDVVCVSGELDAHTVTELLLSKGFGGAPVVDGEGRPIGIISKSDLVREDAYGDGATVAELMVPIALALLESASIFEAAALMAARRIHRVLIVSEEGRVVGLVSSIDVLRWLARENGYLIPEPADRSRLTIT